MFMKKHIHDFFSLVGMLCKQLRMSEKQINVVNFCYLTPS